MHVVVNGARLFFDVEGAKFVADGPVLRERPTLLLLHGGPGADHSTYKPAFASLADVAQIVFLDHRGNGRSEGADPETWRLAQWADDVAAFCEALGIVRPVVLGTSFGGYVALAYATRHPEHASRLVLVSTAARRNPARGYAVYERRGGRAARSAAQRMDEAPGPEALADFVRLCLPLYNTRPPDLDAMARVQWNHPLMFHFMAGERRRFDFLPALHRIRCPTLVLGGDDDPVTPIEDQEEIAAAIGPNARLERFRGCGHGILRDDPARMLAVVRAFLLEAA